MAEKEVRIRLKFQDAGILSKQQIDQGLVQCWHLVRFDEVRTIADVASDISLIFNLGESCPSGLGLEVDGFALPPSQSAHLLKDSDLVRIRRRKDTAIKTADEVTRRARNDHHFIINGYRYGSNGGLDLRAIDEFEKESGGYKSEEEEGEMETDISLDGGGRMLGGPKVPPFFLQELERSRKKRKRAKDPGIDLGKMKRSSSAGLDLSLAKLDTKQEKFKANKVSQGAGVNLRALDEFEGEFGGYESEQEEDGNDEETDFSLGGTRIVVPFEVRPSGTPRDEKRSAKKQKVSKKENLDLLNKDQMPQLKAAAIDVEENLKEAPKKKKKRSSVVEVSRPTEDRADLGRVKRKEKISSKRAEETEAFQNKNENKDSLPESYRKKRSKEKTKNDLVSAPKVRDDSLMDSEDTLMESDNHEDKKRNEDVGAKGGATNYSTPVKESNNAPAEEVNRPSRSARRKKAKRKWLREQQAKAANMPTEEDVVKVPPSNEEVVEVETMAELQPVVVRAGHIRFEPYEEDNSGGEPRSALVREPVINLGEQLKSKRRGQNWGQERFGENPKREKRNKESGMEEYPEANGQEVGKSKSEELVRSFDHEKLPALQDAPQEGDVIAYRLVELTNCWTPELSPFRVGVVVSVDKKTDGIKLAPHPDYPFHPTEDAESDDGAGQESEAYPVPYYEDGSLETELSALIDVRLLEKNLRPNRGQDDEIAWENAQEKGSANPEDGPSSVPPVTESGERTQSSGIKNTRVESETQLVVAEGGDQNPPQEVMSTKPSDDKEEMEKDATPSPDWQTVLTMELQRKKLEIRQKNANAGGNQTSEGHEKTEPAKRRKSKYLRSAGVGSIVALLRAQQSL